MNLFQKMWCKIFDCEVFQTHQSDVAKLKTDMAAIVPIIVGIAAQFPITADLGTIPVEIEALGMPDMSIWFECADAANLDEVVEVDIWAKFTVGAEVVAVGIGNPGASLLGITFDPAHFNFLTGQETRGEDIVDWDLFGIEENNPGQLTFGATAGSARGVIGDKPIHLASIKLQVTTTDFVAAVIQMDNYVDSLADCRPKPATAEVLLNEN